MYSDYLRNNGTSQPNFVPGNGVDYPNYGPMQQDYAVNVLAKNVGKNAKLYMSFSDSLEWRDRVFEGTIEDAGKDFVIVRDNNGKDWHILWLIYLNYVTFAEKINY